MRLSESSTPSSSAPPTIATGLRRLWAMLRRERPGGRITYGDAPSTPADSGLVVGVIDDPDLAVRLLSVRGRVSPASLSSLAAAFAEVRDASRLHVDLTDAEFSDAFVARSFASLLDELDDRRVRLRIVGLGRPATLPID